jgi:ADP-heptose:LPS heptosyltransferase
MQKVLVIHSWGLGDLLLATPMLKSLSLSGYQVDLVLFSAANTIILQENDFIDNIFVFKKRWEFIKFYKQYDYVVSTAGTDPKKIAILNFLIGAKKIFSAHQQKDLHRIEMNLKIVKDLVTQTTKEPYIYIKKESNIVEKYLKKDQKNVGFAVGSGKTQKFKRWKKFKELAEAVEANRLLFIGPDEYDLEEHYKDTNVTIVKESLEDTIALISQLDLLVGNDNGLMHIGYATAIDTITIYGMTNPKETGGYRKNSWSVALNMECMPCFDPKTDKIGCKTIDCLENLSFAEVYKRVEGALHQ